MASVFYQVVHSMMFILQWRQNAQYTHWFFLALLWCFYYRNAKSPNSSRSAEWWMQSIDTFFCQMEGSFSFAWVQRSAGRLFCKHLLCASLIHFVVYGNTKHFQISSNGNSSVFTVEFNVVLPLTFSLQLLGIWRHSSSFRFALPLVDISEIHIYYLFHFLCCAVIEKYLYIITISG